MFSRISATTARRSTAAQVRGFRKGTSLVYALD
jgi:hypothetical protein